MSQFERYEVVWLPVRELSPHPKVQRPLDETRAAAIAAAFDPDLFRELYVVKAPGAPGGKRYWVFDGGTRLAAAIEALGDDQKVPCRIWDSIPIEEQAKLFLGINDSKAVKAIHKWFVRLLAREEVPLKIEEALHRHKLRVSKTRGDGVVQAITTLESIWKRDGGAETLQRVLSILGAAWGRMPEAYDGLLLRGLAGAVHRFDGALDDKELASKMARKGMPGGMVGRARQSAQINAKSPSRAMLEVIINIYNEKRRTNRLEV